MISPGSRRRSWLVAMMVPLALGCGGARAMEDSTRDASLARRRADEPLAGPLVARAELRRRDRLLTSLPPKATYSWVTPSSAFAGVGPAEDAASVGNMAGLRATVMAVLSANGWRTADSASADYRLALVRVDRSGERTTMTPDPRNNDPQPRRCDASTTGPTSRCAEPPRPTYPPIVSRQLYTDRSIGYAIVRASDGAARWWSLNQWEEAEVDKFIAKSTLELLLAVEKQP